MNDSPPNGASLPAIARETISSHFGYNTFTPDPDPNDYLSRPAGVFVTIRTNNGELRGCRGSIKPQFGNVLAETKHVALSSALDDTRFKPIQAHELDDLNYEVSVLHPPEPADSLAEFDPARYGIIVHDPKGRRALMLPDVEGLDTVDKQYKATCRKGRIDPDGQVTLQRFQVDKFKETD